MDDLRLVYGAVNAVWGLRKRYGPGPLKDVEWERFVEEGKRLQRDFAKQDQDVELLFRDWFRALQEYYSRKKSGE